jgi:hypothetical protein
VKGLKGVFENLKRLPAGEGQRLRNDSSLRPLQNKRTMERNGKNGFKLRTVVAEPHCFLHSGDESSYGEFSGTGRASTNMLFWCFNLAMAMFKLKVMYLAGFVIATETAITQDSKSRRKSLQENLEG